MKKFYRFFMAFLGLLVLGKTDLLSQCQSIPSVVLPSCTHTVTTGGVNINSASDVVCVAGNVNLSTVNFNAPGTLVISGGATVSGGINANSGGTLIVEGTFHWSGAANLGSGFSIRIAPGGVLNRSGDIALNSGQNELVNHGDLHVTNNITFLGAVYNAGNIRAHGFNLNSAISRLINGANGDIQVTQFMNVNTSALVENCGHLDVGVNLEVNGGATFINHCTLIVHDFTQQLSVLENHCLIISGISGSGDGFLHQGSRTVLHPGSVLITKDFFWSANGPVELLGNAKIVVAEAVLNANNMVTALNAPGRLRVSGGAQLTGSGTLSLCDIDPVSQGDNPTGVAFPAGVAANVSTAPGTSLNLYQCTPADIPTTACCSGSTGPCPGFNLAVTGTGTTCGQADGTATASASGGTAPYTYLWSNGQTTSTATGLAPGSYTVTVTGADTCQEVGSVTIGGSGGISVGAMGLNTTCGQANGSASAVVTGGTLPFTYLWSNGDTTSVITGLTAGTYSVTVTDAHNCQDVDSVTISASSAPAVAVSGQDASCGLANGSAAASVSGGTAPYTYLWSNGDTTANAAGLSAGSYSVTVTDSVGCQATATLSIGGTSSVQLTISTTASTCGQANGSATATASGGTAPYSYLWSNGDTTATAAGLSAGSYAVTATDSIGCQATATAIVVDDSLFADSCTIAPGEFRSQTQGGWGSSPNGNNPGVYLHAHFAGAFPNGLVVGCTHTLALTTAQAVTDYLPCGGPSNALSQSYVDPSCIGSTVVSQLIAATLSVTFDRYDQNFGASSTHLGDLVVASGPLAGLTVDQVLAEANSAIGGCGSSYSLNQLNQALTNINQNFVDGTSANQDLDCPHPCGNNVTTPGQEPNALRVSAWPNPSTESVQLTVEAPEEGEIVVAIYSAQGGDMVRQLGSGLLSAGRYQFTWDGATDNGNLVSPGLYLVRVSQGQATVTTRVIRF